MRRFVLFALLALPTLAAWAQFPTRTVTLVVPFAPGGSSELLSRVVANELSHTLGQQVVVDNRPGAAGNIAMEAVARAAPDGHTLILGHIGTLAVNPAMFRKLPYDPVRDFAPVSLIGHVPNVVAVGAGVQAKTLQEFIALARARPGSLNYGSAGNGSAGHLAMEYLKQAAGIDLVHVPYKGTGPMVTDLLAGQTQATFTGVPALAQFIRQGKLRALAVGSARRLPSMPEVPTVSESGLKGFETSQWYGVLAPAKTPDAVVRRLSAEVARGLKSREATERLAADGTQIVGSTPEEFAALIQVEMKRWGEVVRGAGIKPD